MKLSIGYKVLQHGWATVTLSDGTKTVDGSVSYLHDSLLELAQMAISIKSGQKETKAVFMDEPGELQLLVHLDSEIAHYEARWYEGWPSWGVGSESDFETILKGSCSSARIIQQITQILWTIYSDIGVKRYKELWCEHEFPLAQFEALSNL